MSQQKVVMGYCVNKNQLGFDNYDRSYPEPFFVVEKILVYNQKTRHQKYCEVFSTHEDALDFIYTQRGRNLINPYNRDVINLKSFWRQITGYHGMNAEYSVKAMAAKALDEKKNLCCIEHTAQNLYKLKGKFQLCQKCRRTNETI